MSPRTPVYISSDCVKQQTTTRVSQGSLKAESKTEKRFCFLQVAGTKTRVVPPQTFKFLTRNQKPNFEEKSEKDPSTAAYVTCASVAFQEAGILELFHVKSFRNELIMF